ncbi:MAG: hypothetical protein ACYTGG_03170 [Planctomycetota bacterium]|jgi:hypothetical protein
MAQLTDSDHAPTRRRRIVLEKDHERWVFEWTPGDEGSLMEHVGRLARSTDVNFDWFDVAVVCRQIRSPVPSTSAATGGATGSEA